MRAQELNFQLLLWICCHPINIATVVALWTQVVGQHLSKTRGFAFLIFSCPSFSHGKYGNLPTIDAVKARNALVAGWEQV